MTKAEELIVLYDECKKKTGGPLSLENVVIDVYGMNVVIDNVRVNGHKDGVISLLGENELDINESQLVNFVPRNF